MFGCFYFSRFFDLTCCDFIVSLPLSLSVDASPTLSSCVPLSNHHYLSQSTYLHLLLYLSFTLRIAIILSLFVHISNFQSLWRNLWLYFTLSLRHYSSPSSIPVMIWLSSLLFCFFFDNYYFSACLFIIYTQILIWRLIFLRNPSF